MGITGKGLGQNLDSDLPVKPSIASTIYLARAAGPRRCLDSVRTKFRARGEDHRVRNYRLPSISQRTCDSGRMVGQPEVIQKRASRRSEPIGIFRRTTLLPSRL